MSGEGIQAKSYRQVGSSSEYQTGMGSWKIVLKGGEWSKPNYFDRNYEKIKLEYIFRIVWHEKYTEIQNIYSTISHRDFLTF